MLGVKTLRRDDLVQLFDVKL